MPASSGGQGASEQDGVRFPVYLDPSVGLEKPKRVVLSNHPDFVPLWNFTEAEGMGLCKEDPRCEAPHVKRMYFQFARGKAKDKRVLTAVFKARETWSWSCTKSTVDLYVMAKGISARSTWKTRPIKGTRVASRKVAYGNPRCDSPNADVEFQSSALTAAAKQLANGTRTRLTVMLRARSETSSDGWKRFTPNALLRVVYANVPQKPTVVGVKTGAGARPNCGSSMTQPTLLAETTPDLVAKITAKPVTGAKLQAYFEVQRRMSGETKWPAADDLYWSGYSPTGTPSKASGSTEIVSSASFPDETSMYRMRASAISLTYYTVGSTKKPMKFTSDPSRWCYFQIRVAAPHAPVVTSQGPYESCTDTGCLKRGGPDVPGTFVFTSFAGTSTVPANAADQNITEFSYQFLTLDSDGDGVAVEQEDTAEGTVVSGGKKMSVTATRSGSVASAQITVPPRRYGPARLQVWADDGAGEGEPTRFDFWVMSAAEPVAQWSFADDPEASSAADTAARDAGTAGFPLTLRAATSGGTTAQMDPRGRHGDVDGDHGLGLDGASAFAESSAPVTSGAKNTVASAAPASFTVSAWVYRQSETTATVVSQTGNDAVSSGWDLYYSASYEAWVFNWHWNTAEGKTQYRRSKAADGSVSPVGVWTHLVGVFDSQSGAEPTVRLFVDGRAQSDPVSVQGADFSVTTPGHLQVGRVNVKQGVFQDYLKGVVDEVRVWDRVLNPAEIAQEAQALAWDPVGDRRHTALVADWSFDDADPDPDNTPDRFVVPDASEYQRRPLGYSLPGADLTALVGSDPGIVVTAEDFADSQDVVAETEEPSADGEGLAETSQDETGSGAQVLALDGTSGYASTAGPVIDATASFTLSATVAVDPAVLAGKPVGYRAQVLGQQAGNGAAESTWGLWWTVTENTGGAVQGIWSFEHTSYDGAGQVTETVTAEQVDWVLGPVELVEVTGVWDASTRRAKVFVEGSERASIVGGTDSPGALGGVWGRSGEFSVGRARRGGKWTDHWPGYVERVRVWVGAMASEQVAAQVVAE